MSNDAVEFLEAAKEFKPSPPNATKEWTGEEVNASMNPEDFKDAETPIGKLAQYSYNGGGFSPTSATTKSLPPDVYSVENVNHLLTFMPRKVNTDKLIRLPDSKSDAVISRIKKFWGLKDEFKNGNEHCHGGYMHKLGIMLFGPPGSGKTSTVKFIMKDIIGRGGIVILGDGNPAVIGEGLAALRLIEPEKPVVIVFEDFDELIHRYSESHYLSMLDGERSIDNALFIATTNYPSRLDPRLYNRPGRFSDVIKIGMPSRDARELYLSSYLKKPEAVQEIADQTNGFSLDHLKALILGVYFEGRSLDDEIKRLKSLFKPPKDDNNEGGGLGIGANL